MYIIQDIEGGLPLFHHMGAITFNGPAVSVNLTTRFAEPQNIGGVMTEQPYEGRSVSLPQGTFDEDTVSKAAVADWLVGPDGFFSGARLVSDDNFAVAAAQARFFAKVRAKRDAAQAGGCTIEVRGEALRFDTTINARVNLAGSVTMALLAKQASEDFSMDWRTADNRLVALDADEMIAVGSAVARYVSDCQSRKNELDALIAAIVQETSEEELALIEAQIPKGWPE